MLRWGWKPSDFLLMGEGERAFVVAGLELEGQKRK
jgi:hypothetical protein